MHGGGEGRRGALRAGAAGTAPGALWPAGRAWEAEVRRPPALTVHAVLAVFGSSDFPEDTGVYLTVSGLQHQSSLAFGEQNVIHRLWRLEELSKETAIVKKKRNRRKNFVQMQLLYINFLLPSLKDTLGSMQSDLGIQCELVLGWVSLTVTSLGTLSWCRHERFGPTPQVGVLGGKTLPNSAICAHSACRVTPCHCTR